MSDLHPETKHFTFAALPLESCETLYDITIAYRTWGALDRSRSNAILICHGLTAGADADLWWAPLIGRDRAFDPSNDFIISSNVIGGCYGSTGPSSMNPRTGRRYGASFPKLTIRDMVAAQERLVSHLGVRSIELVVGGSMGGMQALEWALCAPELVRAIAPIASTGRHSPWAIALGSAQRQAIYADPAWRGGTYDPAMPPTSGLSVARMMAMATYRSPAGLESRFGRSLDDGLFSVEQWLTSHGAKLVRRFDANSYVRLIEAMDSHDVARGRGEYRDVLASIEAASLVVSIDSDLLYPPAEQRELALLMRGATLEILHSAHGHDAFLIDAEAVGAMITRFRTSLSHAVRARTTQVREASSWVC